jgi:hypothetical protein
MEASQVLEGKKKLVLKAESELTALKTAQELLRADGRAMPNEEP